MPKTPKRPVMGRPPLPPHLRRVSVPIRLPLWLAAWIDAQEVARSDVIEAALMKAHKLKEPKA